MFNPHHVFTFEDDGVTKTGEIWFVAKLKGFSQAELAMITELLYRYLENYNPAQAKTAGEYCIVVDANTNGRLSYNEINTKKTSSGLIRTVIEMKKLM